MYDTKGATSSDIVIYIGPSSCDAWAEVGAAWYADVPVFGLWAKNEQIGLMRRMVSAWFSSYEALLDTIATHTTNDNNRCDCQQPVSKGVLYKSESCPVHNLHPTKEDVLV